MSRQYMSTFRNKLNPNPQPSKRNPIFSSSNKSGTVMPLLRNFKDRSVKSEINSKEETKKTPKFDETIASKAINKNKAQVEILESALATLRLKERRALRELESEMRKYRKSVVAGSKKSRKTNLSRYSWENIFPSLENEDVILKRRGKTPKVKNDNSDQKMANCQKCRAVDVVNGNENENKQEKHFNEENEYTSEKAAMDTSKEGSEEDFTTEIDHKSTKEKSNKTDKAKSPESSAEDYLGLIKFLSQTQISKICNNEDLSLCEDQEDLEDPLKFTLNEVSHNPSEEEYKKDIKTLRLRDRATQFEPVYTDEVDDQPPKEIWPSWFSENNKQVQTDSMDFQPKERVLNNVRPTTLSFQLDPHNKSEKCFPQLIMNDKRTITLPKNRKPDYVKNDQGVEKQCCSTSQNGCLEQKAWSHRPSQPLNCANSSKYPTAPKQTFITSFEEPYSELKYHHLPNNGRSRLKVSPQSTSRRRGQRRHLEKDYSPSASQNKQNLPCCVNETLAKSRADIPEWEDHYPFSQDSVLECDCQVNKIKSSNDDDFAFFKDRAIGVKGQSRMSVQQRDNIFPVRNTTSFEEYGTDSKYHIPMAHRQIQRKSKPSIRPASSYSMAPLPVKKVEKSFEEKLSVRNLPSASRRPIPNFDRRLFSPNQPIVEESSIEFSNRGELLSRVSAYWSPVSCMEGRRPSTANVVSMCQPSHHNIVLQIEVSNPAENNVDWSNSNPSANLNNADWSNSNPSANLNNVDWSNSNPSANLSNADWSNSNPSANLSNETPTKRISPSLKLRLNDSNDDVPHTSLPFVISKQNSNRSVLKEPPSPVTGRNTQGDLCSSKVGLNNPISRPCQSRKYVSIKSKCSSSKSKERNHYKKRQDRPCVRFLESGKMFSNPNNFVEQRGIANLFPHVLQKNAGTFGNQDIHTQKANEKMSDFKTPHGDKSKSAWKRPHKISDDQRKSRSLTNECNVPSHFISKHDQTLSPRPPGFSSVTFGQARTISEDPKTPEKKARYRLSMKDLGESKNNEATYEDSTKKTPKPQATKDLMHVVGLNFSSPHSAMKK